MYLKSISLHNFKSFHSADLMFSNGFTCVVGPNGSGKSNICDALLFALGESSMRRLRVNKLEMLINSASALKKNKDSLPKAHVKLLFANNEGKQVEVLRIVRSDGKSAFHLNGKHAKRNEIIEELRAHRLVLNDTNTITQGEINKLIYTTPKERRELIDIAAGIKEFDEKKNEALKELGKVEIRLSEAKLIMGERSGFLAELEKEKSAAEKYLALKEKLALLRYNVLAKREKDASVSYNSIMQELAKLDASRAELAKELSELNSSLDALTQERQSITKELSESTLSAGADAKKLEMLNTDIAKVNAQLDSTKSLLSERKKQIVTSKDELKACSVEIDSINSEMAGIRKRTKELEPMLGISNNNADSGKERMESIDSRLRELDKVIAALNSKIAILNADNISTDNYITTEQSKYENARDKLAILKKEHNELNKQLSSLKVELSKSMSLLNRKDDNATGIRKEIDSIDTKLISVREQRAMYHGRESSYLDNIRNAFTEKDGFYGKVSDIVTYPAEYSQAIDSAASARMDYLVVNNIGTASKIIEFLKQNSLGRATFIPISELNVKAHEKQSVGGAIPVLDLVSFDPKYSKVFEYVFGGTYLISRIEDAKKLGIGQRRYVTKEGDLVESSGVVSGGNQKRRVSLSSLDNSIKELNARKEELISKLSEGDSLVERQRTDKARIELEHNSVSVKLEMLAKELEEAESLVQTSLKNVESSKSKLSTIASAEEQAKSTLSSNMREYNALKEEQSSLYNAYINSAKTAATDSQGKQLAKELEELKMHGVELSTRGSMLEAKKKQTETSISSMEKEMEEQEFSARELDAKYTILSKGKAELEEKASAASSVGKKAYERLQAIDTEINAMSTQRGSISAKLETFDRNINDSKLKSSQLEVRISDLKAELASYQTTYAIIEESVEKLEADASATSMLLNEMSNVNLKAPEAYEIRKKELDEIQGRLNTIEAERDSVMHMIDEIDSKKLNIFVNTFDAVNKNFSKLFNYIFPGKAQIELENPKEPFNSGLFIKITEGKTSKRESSMSGGERSLVLLMLLFAIHSYKPSSLYIFDEVDTALDKENSKKLSKLIKELSANSQFVVVSHNDSLIMNADAAIGVTKSENESKAIGLDIRAMLAKAATANKG